MFAVGLRAISRPLLPQTRRTLATMSSQDIFKVNNLFNVEGWVCLVSGGGTGIGALLSSSRARLFDAFSVLPRLDDQSGVGEQRRQSLWVLTKPLLGGISSLNIAILDIAGRRKDVLENTASTHGSSLVHPSGQLIPVQADVSCCVHRPVVNT